MSNSSNRSASSIWTAETIDRLWNHVSAQPYDRTLYFTRHFSDKLIRLAQLVGLRDGEVLDYGCGAGYLTKALVDAGFRTTALEFAERSVAETNARVGNAANYRGCARATGTPTPLSSAAFDFIFSVETYEHLLPELVEPYVAELHRLLRPGGILMLTTPNEERLEEREVYCPFCDTRFHRWGHLRSVTAGALRSLLVERGFQIVSVRALQLQDVAKQRPALADVSYNLVKAELRSLARRAKSMLASNSPASSDPLARYAPGPHLVAIAVRSG